VSGVELEGRRNGPTGAEGAAAPGLVAGLNAARLVRGQDAVVFRRADSYIGVMVDDLTSRGVSEPYRMFTSRAEFRLSLRADNADQRLPPLAFEVGCISDDRVRAFGEKIERLNTAKSLLSAKAFTPSEAVACGLSVSQDGTRRTAFQLLSFPGANFEEMIPLQPELEDVDFEIRRQIERDAVYSNYLGRQQAEIDALKKDEAQKIPFDFDYATLGGLSNELKAKLIAARPETLAQAARIDGITPAALTLILAKLRHSTTAVSA